MTQPASDAVLASTPRVRTTIRLPLLLSDGRESLALLHSFNGLVDDKEHVALQFGEPTGTPLVRLHSECMTGDVLGSARCDCGPQLQESLRRLHDEGGYLLYLRQEGRGIGLYRKLEAYHLQDLGHDTFAANRLLGHCDDERDYTAAAQMLAALGVQRIALLTNNPDKRSQLEQLGVEVTSVRETSVYANRHNLDYLQTKIRHAGHVMALWDKDEEYAAG